MQTQTDYLITSKCVQNLNLSQLLQIGMNWKCLKPLSDELKTNCDNKVLNIASCGLHVMHNAFQTGIEFTDWKIYDTLSSLYTLFKDSPACRGEDIKQVNKSSFFGFKF